MKIHIYKWPMDKIPLNAVPFYKNDTAEFIEETINDLKWKTEYATNYYDISTFEKIDFWEEKDSMIEYYKEYFGENIAEQVKNCIENWALYSIRVKFEDAKRHLLIFTTINEYNNLIVYNLFPERTMINISFRGFLKLLNEKFKELWVDSVAYHFPVAHCLKPDLSKEDYDRVIRLWATDDYMWTRCYIKYFNKKK